MKYYIRNVETGQYVANAQTLSSTGRTYTRHLRNARLFSSIDEAKAYGVCQNEHVGYVGDDDLHE